MNAPELILYNGKITTLDEKQPQASTVAIHQDRFESVGGDEFLASAAIVSLFK